MPLPEPAETLLLRLNLVFSSSSVLRDQHTEHTEASHKAECPEEEFFIMHVIGISDKGALCALKTHNTQSVWRFFVEENTGPYNDQGTPSVLGTADCSMNGCQSRVTMTINTRRIQALNTTQTKRPTAAPVVCFLEIQGNPNCKSIPTSGGCPGGPTTAMTTWGCFSLQLPYPTNFVFHIDDPWTNRWVTGQHGATFPSQREIHPTGYIKIYRKWVWIKPPTATLEELTNTTLNHQEILHSQVSLSDSPTKAETPFSWVKLIQQGIHILNLISLHSPSNCFLCALLQQAPITAVPLTYSLSGLTTTPEPFSLPGVTLFQPNISQPIPVCYSAQKHPHCNQTISLTQFPATSPNGTHFWCNSTLLKTLTQPSSTPCIPVIIAPQLVYYKEEEFANHLSTSRARRAVFIPVILGLTLATSIAALGIGSAGLGHSLVVTNQLRADLEQALDNSATSLASLQRQLTSLAQVSLQNRRALDLLMAEKGGTCLFLQEQCCYYINESGVIEENVQSLRKLQEKLRKYNQQQDTFTPEWWKSPLFSMLAPILGLLLIICILLMFAPLLLRFVQTRLREITRVAVHQMMLLHTEDQISDELLNHKPCQSPNLHQTYLLMENCVNNEDADRTNELSRDALEMSSSGDLCRLIKRSERSGICHYKPGQHIQLQIQFQ
ncbi:ERV-BabFcenv provirus ancestral Env polyprotein-like [Rhynchonycteris naso]